MWKLYDAKKSLYMSLNDQIPVPIKYDINFTRPFRFGGGIENKNKHHCGNYAYP